MNSRFNDLDLEASLKILAPSASENTKLVSPVRIPELSEDEDFDINGTPMSFPSDPKGGAKNVINCRCVLVYVDEDDLSLIKN